MSSSPLVLEISARRRLSRHPEPSAPGGPSRFQAQLRMWLPVAACALVFAVESTKYFGADHTSEPLRRVAVALFGSAVNAHWALLHHLIRKTGHFTGYGLFSLVCFRAFWKQFAGISIRLQRQLQAHGLTIAVTFLVASADEFHQSFLPNRTGQFSDVLLDTCGAAVLGLLLFLVMRWTDKLKPKQGGPRCALGPACAELAG